MIMLHEIIAPVLLEIPSHSGLEEAEAMLGIPMWQGMVGGL